MSFAEISLLLSIIRDRTDRPIKEIRELEVDRWNKISLPLSSLVFALLAIPMGVRPSRSGSSVGLGLSIFIIFLYWLIWRYTSAMAIQGQISPFVGAFLADALGVTAAFILMKNAAK